MSRSIDDYLGAWEQTWVHGPEYREKPIEIPEFVRDVFLETDTTDSEKLSWLQENGYELEDIFEMLLEFNKPDPEDSFD